MMRATILPLQPATPATTLPPAQIARIAKAARDFEAMALGQMLQPMFETVDRSKNPLGGGAAEAAWKPMLVNEIAQLAQSDVPFDELADLLSIPYRLISIQIRSSTFGISRDSFSPPLAATARIF